MVMSSLFLSVRLAVSYFMEGREPTQLIYRWTHFLDPSLKKGPWTPEEDQVGEIELLLLS